MLARLPIRAWITTNYDEMIENALLGTGKKPLRMWRPERFSQTGFVDQPLVVKIHGDVNNPEDLVLTEVDFVDYILNIGDSRDWLSRIVGDSCLLLLGWSYRNLENRFFLRLLRVHDSTIAFAVDPAPDVLMRQSEELRALHIIEDDLWSFVPRLVEAYARLT
jgi:hypothetical protein